MYSAMSEGETFTAKNIALNLSHVDAMADFADVATMFLRLRPAADKVSSGATPGSGTLHDLLNFRRSRRRQKSACRHERQAHLCPRCADPVRLRLCRRLDDLVTALASS